MNKVTVRNPHAGEHIWAWNENDGWGWQECELLLDCEYDKEPEVLPEGMDNPESFWWVRNEHGDVYAVSSIEMEEVYPR